MIRYIGTDPRKSVLMPRAISLRSRVLGNWQARFWRPVERGDPSAEFNQPQGDHLTGPEVRLRMFGDGAHLLIDLVEQCRDKIEGDHGLLRAWPGVMLSTSVEEVHDHDNKTIKYYRVSLVCQRLTPLVTTRRSRRPSWRRPGSGYRPSLSDS